MSKTSGFEWYTFEHATIPVHRHGICQHARRKTRPAKNAHIRLPLTGSSFSLPGLALGPSFRMSGVSSLRACSKVDSTPNLQQLLSQIRAHPAVVKHAL